MTPPFTEAEVLYRFVPTAEEIAADPHWWEVQEYVLVRTASGGMRGYLRHADRWQKESVVENASLIARLLAEREYAGKVIDVLTVRNP